ncbi:GDP-mannose 4,6-dehydratase [Candidatus Pelagibacter sp.]|uniref:GDP-mannose 4,6-dehydratase n=1 Tax=Candidatus Pelagibacter sp. TaxID=2024849 RepID=UPI003F829140
MTKKKNIVITGVLGQDGQILSNILIKKKYNIIGIVKKIPKKRKSMIKFKKINLLNYSELSKFLDKCKLESLIHLGTENPNYLELKKKLDFYKKNLTATKNLIDYFSKQQVDKRLILIGTSQMYGNKKKKVNLNSRFKPINSYAKFRVAAYNYMLKSKKKYKSNIITAILFNHDSKFRKKKFLIPRLIKIIKKKQIKKLSSIYKENISGDFSHAEDICHGLYKLLLLKNCPDKLIFSSNKRTYMNKIIHYLIKINKLKIKFKTNILKNTFTPVGDNRLTKKILNWEPKKNIFIAAKELNK